MSYRLLLICIVFSSCTAGRMIETNLFFGQSKPGGGFVTESEWKSFKENQMANAFKEGSTVLNATGNWRDPDTHQLITEPTYVVIYYYKKSALMSRRIDSLRNWYVTAFKQQSVLRVDKRVKVNF